MGWFDDQIEYRKAHEREQLSDSFEGIARSITGRKINTSFRDGADVTDAISQICKHFGVKQKAIPEGMTELEKQLETLLFTTGILYRKVELTKGWHNDAMGALITSLKADGAVIAVIQGNDGRYTYTDPHTGKRVKITSLNECNIETDAFCFYRPLPARAIKLRDILRYMITCLNTWDILSFVLATLIITLIGLLMPRLNYLLMGDIIALGSEQLLAALVSFLLFATIGSLLFSSIRSLLLGRVRGKIQLSVQSATMMRVLSLPTPFFKDYSTGELDQYLSYMDSLCDTLVSSVLSMGISSIFSLVYIFQIFSFASSLVLPSVLVALITLGISLGAAAIQTGRNRESMKIAAKQRGLVYSLITGIQKIRLSGSENRAFVKWAKLYSRQSDFVYNQPTALKLVSVISTGISLIGTMIIYYIAVKTKVTVSEYYAFNTAFAYVSSAFSMLASVAMTISTIKPGLDIIKPLLDAEPELSEGRETVTSLNGGIELAHVSFSYKKDGPVIINDLNLNISPRQYVAIVGRSGCGKSTLVKLLLGFEKPTRGSIYYDKRDTAKLDMRSVRRQIGTVMQDGKLFSGSLFENISISAPSMSHDQAWEAAEISGIADDIRMMPMGMNTIVQEGGGGISGGQRQRLMIARAIAPKPKILIFDEATSALDNITQKKVSEALDKMKCTRIVIAHRLSTIKNCNRIIVLDGGKIVEDGTYDKLVANNGFFAELVKRQMVDQNAK